VNITYVFFLGFIVAVIGVLPPGLLNMSAAKISLDEGRSRGIIFSLGAFVIILLQTYVATVFAKYLSRNAEIITTLRFIAFVVFFVITIYFLFIAKPKEKTKKTKRKGKKSSFFYGMFLSTLNILPIPYNAYMSITLASYGWVDYSKQSVISYIAGVGIGSFLTLYAYLLFFYRFKDKTFIPQKNMNYIIGSVTGVIALITLFNIIKN